MCFYSVIDRLNIADIDFFINLRMILIYKTEG